MGTTRRTASAAWWCARCSTRSRSRRSPSWGSRSRRTRATRASRPPSTCAPTLRERARLSIYDPKVPHDQIWMDLTEPGVDAGSEEEVRKNVTLEPDSYAALEGAHAAVVCTEWPEFKELDWKRVYDVMEKPAFVFDGRLILDHAALKDIGFEVFAVGK